MITQKEIDRINTLAKKAKTPEGLTDLERSEQARLRKAYIAAVRENLTAQLDNTYIQTPDGKKRKLEPKGGQDGDT